MQPEKLKALVHGEDYEQLADYLSKDVSRLLHQVVQRYTVSILETLKEVVDERKQLQARVKEQENTITLLQANAFCRPNGDWVYVHKTTWKIFMKKLPREQKSRRSHK